MDKIKDISFALVIDLGGTGRYIEDSKGNPVININITNRSDYPGLKGQLIPNYMFGDVRSALVLPEKSVSKMYAESMPITNQQWSKEMLRVMKPGGKIIIYSTPAFVDSIIKLFKEANPKIEVKKIGDYLKDYPDRAGGKYPGGGEGAEITVPKE